MNLKNLVWVGALACATAATAQSTDLPRFFNPTPGTSTVIQNMSDDGKWAVASVASTTDGSIATEGATLISLEDYSQSVSIKTASGFCGASDVSDGGNIVVGTANMKPAYWSRTTGNWTVLEVPAGYKYGQLISVTPDGRYAVGVANPDDEMIATPVMYDLTANKLLELKNVPNIDKTGRSQNQNWFAGVSSDGRYVFGMVSFSYMGETASYVYDRETETYDYLGMNIYPAGNSSATWTATSKGVYFVDNGQFSPNGKYLAGDAYMVYDDSTGSEGRSAYLYNVETKEFTVFDKPAERDYSALSVDNDGTIYVATPADNPYASAYVRYNGYYYSVAQILKNAWGIDNLERATGFDITGKPINISADGLTIAFLPSIYDTYIAKFPKKLSEMCADINLLDDYQVSPAEGTAFSYITDVRIAFERDVQLVGNATRIKLLDDKGNQVRAALSCSVDGNNATVSFRGTSLEKGKEYTVNVPAGMFCIDGDRNVKSSEINIKYVGRGTESVKLVEAYPADGAAFATIDINVNPLVLTFDAEVAVAEGAVASFSRVGEDGYKICDLYMMAGGRQVAVYPLSGQHLYAGIEYQVVIPAGAITDISGNGPSAEILLNYEGTYVNEVPADSRYLFFDECDNYDNWIRYDGDQLTPDATPASWGFEANGAWRTVRSSDESSDQAFASHSMYSPAGQSNDWVVTHQIYVPDDKAFLRFDSQSYLKACKDVLKVIVLASDDIYQEPLNASIIEKFETDGDVIYNETQSPGASQEGLEGDWEHNVVNLAAYAGKNIYIAFVNQNTNQSAIFIDNVQVVREVKFTYNMNTPARVVAQKSAAISGVLGISAEEDTFTSIQMVLKDGTGTEISSISENGLELSNGSIYKFSFADELPLAAGEVNKYTIDITLGGEVSTIAGSVKNLTFQPVQKVVLEEFTGSGCVNCPLGIRAIENMEAVYGHRFIPITIRTYMSDELGEGMSSYSTFLGLSAAPSGRINRGVISSPMISLGDGRYTFSGEGITMSDGSDSNLWLDYAQKEFNAGTDMEVTVSASTYDADTKAFTADVVVRSAVNLSNQNVNLLAVITENNLESDQESNVYTYTDPNLGEWGAGGKYAEALVYPYYFNDVARAAFGATYNGTGGLIPATLAAGQEYTAKVGGTFPDYIKEAENCMVNILAIDGNTNRIITAERVALRGNSLGVEDSVIDGGNANVAKIGNSIAVSAQGHFSVDVYAVDGALLASAEGSDVLTIAAPASGVVIVRVKAADGITTVKLNI